ncbi:S1 family peptidase [Halomicrobium urmianum]|uniref:S1 family peptidase n=1 Tax=Halomicrobium urmianum TaxID=1586233 RepID=UPI001CD9C24D|nr:S1 family peptidase [Halomicrobium urmianum]
MADRFGRRTFLTTIGSAATLSTAGCSVRSGSSNGAQVPTLLAGDEAVRRDRVPDTWKAHVETVWIARERLGEQLSGLEDVVGLKVVRSDVEYGGRPGLRLGVELASPEAEIDLPKDVEGIPVSVEEALERGLSACYNDADFDPVPGGVIVEAAEGGAFGTACCRVFDGGEPRLLTAAHLWESCNREDAVGSRTTQNGRYLGPVVRYDQNRDVAMVAPEELELDGDIKLIGSERRPIGGRVSEWGLALFLTGDHTVRKIGTSSGNTTGRVTGMAVEEGWEQCVDFGGNGVEAEYRNVPGDSGGPVFYEHEGEAFLVSVQQMWLREVGTACDDRLAADRGRGTAAAHLREQLGIQFVE